MVQCGNTWVINRLSVCWKWRQGFSRKTQRLARQFCECSSCRYVLGGWHRDVQAPKRTAQPSQVVPGRSRCWEAGSQSLSLKDYLSSICAAWLSQASLSVRALPGATPDIPPGIAAVWWMGTTEGVLILSYWWTCATWVQVICILRRPGLLRAVISVS
jgi:hypothetical protein